MCACRDVVMTGINRYVYNIGIFKVSLIYEKEFLRYLLYIKGIFKVSLIYKGYF
jgi:hypothetical protein